MSNPTRDCERCGNPLPTRNTRARYCSSTCRRQAHEARRYNRPESLTIPAPGQTLEVAPGDVANALTAWLRDRRAEGGPLAAAALSLAERIDSGRDGSAGLAAAVRALTGLLAEIDNGTARQADVIDLLIIKRRLRAIDPDKARAFEAILDPATMRALSQRRPAPVEGKNND